MNWLQRFPFQYLGRLPLPFLYILLYPLYIILYKVIRYRLKTVRSNIKKVFPQYTTKQAKQIEKQYYKYLIRLLAEIFHGTHITEAELTKRVQVKNEQILQEYHTRKQPIILLLGHIGNWEMLGQACNIYCPQDCHIVYKPIQNPTIDPILKQNRERFGAQTVSMQNTWKRLLTIKNQSAMLIMVSDQSPSNIKNLKPFLFFNQPTYFLNGPEILGNKTQYPILFFKVTSSKSGYYTGEFKVIVDSYKNIKQGDITRAYIKELEENIEEAPTLWLWSHRRWKRKIKSSN